MNASQYPLYKWHASLALSPQFKVACFRLNVFLHVLVGWTLPNFQPHRVRRLATLLPAIVLFSLLIFADSAAQDASPDEKNSSSINEVMKQFLGKPLPLSLGTDIAQENFNALKKIFQDAAHAPLGSAKADELISSLTNMLKEYEDAMVVDAEEHPLYQDSDIIKELGWSVDELSHCNEHRKEFLDSIGDSGITSQNALKQLKDTFTFSDDILVRCAQWFEGIYAALEESSQMRSQELQELRKESEELEAKNRTAKKINDRQLMEQLKAEMDANQEKKKIVKREIERIERVKRHFDLELFIQGLFKLVFGVINWIFAQESCGEQSDHGCLKRQKEAQNHAVFMMAEGAAKLTKSFDPPDELVKFTEIVEESEARPKSASQREADIKELLEKDASALCCAEKLVESGLEVIPTNGQGPVSFGFTRDEEGGVLDIQLIDNETGTVRQVINDKSLFHIGGPSLPDINLNTLVDFSMWKYTKTNGILAFVGTLNSEESVILFIQLAPLTESGKYKIVRKML